MANAMYQQGAAHLLGKVTKVDLVADTIKVMFYSSTFSNAHEFVTDLTGASIIARSGALASKTTTNGTFDAADITILAVTGAAFTHVILYKDTGTDSSSPLVAFFDVTSYTPTGADVSVVFNASGILAIA